MTVKNGRLQLPSIAKISLPRLVEVVPRPNLFQALDDYSSRALVWIKGPGGSGKTTAAASYIQTRDIPYLWYQLAQPEPEYIFDQRITW